MKAAIYCRISLDQTGEGLGVTRQQEDCQRLADQLGWEVVEIYVDNDISATSGKIRPAYRKMLADLDARSVDAIVAWHPDRLYRRATDLHDLVETCKRTNAQIATVNAGTVDLTSASGRLVAGLLAQVAIYEGEHKAERWKRSVRQRRERGDFAPSGPRMYGWTRDGQIIDSEADVIRWIAAEIIAGASMHGLARQLEQRGVTTTQGNPFQIQGLKRLMTNPKLAGHSTLNGDIVGRGNWAPILDNDTWETVRAMVTLNARKRKPPARVALLTGLLHCGACGAPMVTGARMKKDKTTQRVYRCTRAPGAKGCGKISARADTVEQIVEAYARKRLDDDRVRASIARLSTSPAENMAEINGLELRIQELEAQLGEPGVPVPTILRAIDRAKERLEETLGAVAAAPRIELPAHGGEWPEDLARRRKLVALVVESVRLNPAAQFGVFDPKRVQIQGKS